MKKIFSLGLALVMSACFCNFALAAETSDVQDCAYVIQVDSQEEYDHRWARKARIYRGFCLLCSQVQLTQHLHIE